MTDNFLAPLSTDKLQEMASEAFGYVPDSKTVKIATEYARLVLREAERLAEPWRKRQLCALNGHVFEVDADSMTGVAAVQNSSYRIAGWRVQPTQCLNCDGILEVTYKEMI